MDKHSLRERVWDTLEASGDARFPFPPHGRIPNFAGADDAAERLAATDEWQAAATIKANPDSPQRPVRRRALEAGKTVYMAVPRLSDEQCFLELDPARIDDVDRATTISGSSELGEQVGPEAVGPIDLIVSGSVAVTTDGARVGKGEGYSDLEYAVLRELGLVDAETPVATTVHESQVVDDEVPIESHDVPMDVVATPERTVHTETAATKPAGIDWDLLSEERRAEIPVLDRFAPE
ncbi:5-formyltetrahydrofolate cyclo-ligase [Halorientalis brevis]|uniref:5-formyltetrahydrofolate cyclo-ligase n=1 Tax=Halorientalis brevis TaxID=1126241 RepID=A0ABD6C6I2_9EURY|nr:5-formyltetrahydrofolate cyclo-ligase [Halorientalis brevis]